MSRSSLSSNALVRRRRFPIVRKTQSLIPFILGKNTSGIEAYKLVGYDTYLVSGEVTHVLLVVTVARVWSNRNELFAIKRETVAV